MDLIHSTFQASFNARIERLAEQETNELRTIFRYFDTDGDGAVAADQVLRIFGLLGLNINPAYVRDLEEVYLAEFLKIVDSNVPVTAASESASGATPNGSTVIVPKLATTVAPNGIALTPSDPTQQSPATTPPDEETEDLANAQLWQEEWRAVDSYGRGYVSRDELRLFLRSCFAPFPAHDLDRFLELYADPSMPENSMTLTKAAFLRFRRDYTSRERAQSEHGTTSEDEDGGGEQEGEQDDLAVLDDAQRTGATGEDDATQPSQDVGENKKTRAKQSNTIAQVGDDVHAQQDEDVEVDGIVIDPGVMDDEFGDEDEDGAVGEPGGDDEGVVGGREFYDDENDVLEDDSDAGAE